MCEMPVVRAKGTWGNALLVRLMMTATRAGFQATNILLDWLFLFLLLVALAQFRDIDALPCTPQLAELNEVCKTDG